MRGPCKMPGVGLIAVATALAGCGRVGDTAAISNSPAIELAQDDLSSSDVSLIDSNTLGFTIQRGTEGARVSLAESSRGWAIQRGEILITGGRANGTVCAEKSLRINHLVPRPGFRIAKISIPNRRALQEHGIPNIVDSNAACHAAVGYTYRGQDIIHVNYTPGHPLTDIPAEPGIWNDPPTARLTLIFEVPEGASVASFRVNYQVIRDWSSQSVPVSAAVSMIEHHAGEPTEPAIALSDAIGCVFDRGSIGPGVSLVSSGDEWAIQSGEARIDRAASVLRFGTGRVSRLFVPAGFSLVRVTGTESHRLPAQGRPVMTDVSGKEYAAVGFLLQNREGLQVRYTPDQPLTELPTLPASATVENPGALKLYFLIPEGTKVSKLLFGEVVLDEWVDPFHVDVMRRR